MSSEKKVTRAITLKAIKEVIEGNVDSNVIVEVDEAQVSVADMFAYIDNQLSQIADKAEKEKAKAAEKASQPDLILNEVKNLISEEEQTAEDILNAMDEGFVSTNEVTKAKVTSRLSKLARDGVVVKGQTKVDKRTLTTYKLA